MKWVDCIAFMLIENGQVLAERRKLTKAVEPGVMALPGGHCEEGETLKESLLRELKEELEIIPHDFIMCVRYSINHKNIESSITMRLNRGRG